MHDGIDSARPVDMIICMNAMRRIRLELFGLQQSNFAVIAGVTQATVSRWENGEFSPRLEEMQRIREEARSRGLAWDDALFFATPNGHAA